MNLKYLLAIIPCTIVALTTMGALSFPKQYFAEHSTLASGKWVKISVDSTGIYELPDTLLARLGFDDPSRVAIFGHGAMPKEAQFINNKGTVIVDSNLHAVPRLLHNGKLLFYGIGPSWMDFKETDSINIDGHFKRNLKHIYSRRGYYILTDASTPTQIDTITYVDTTAAVQPQFALSKIFEDKDIYQGINGNGQLYFTTKCNENEVYKWNLSPSGIQPSSPVTFEINAFTTYEEKGNESAKWTFKLDSQSSIVSTTPSNSTEMLDNFTDPIYGTFNGTTAKISLSAGDGDISHAALDYWAMTYRMNLPAEKGSDRDMAIPSSKVNLQIPISSNYTQPMVWDISDARTPRVIPHNPENAHEVLLTRKDTINTPRITVFDLNETQRQVRIEGEIKNTDIHSQATQGADLVIITIPSLRAKAEELAQMHRDKDNLQVIVAEVGDIYNEFNSGTPDIMAYKSLIKMVYEANAKDKFLNVLLFGPLRCDALGLINEPDYDSFIIAYQSNRPAQDGDVQNVNDFLGMMSDNITTRLERTKIDVGIGILPVANEQEASQVINKISQYIDYPNYDQINNKLLGIAGSGDNNLHTEGVLRMAKEAQTNFNKSLLFTPYIMEAYTQNEQKGRLASYINDDYLLGFYLGHGSSAILNSVAPIFYKGEISTLHNKILPFMLFGTCDITCFDKGVRGIAESMIIDTPNGTIGGVLSTRKAFSNQNETMVKLFFKYLASTDNAPALKQSKTIGEVYANTKTNVRTVYENTFQLVCDPTLRIPVPVLVTIPSEEIDLTTLVPGKTTLITGKICTRDNVDITNFNGTITAKILAPATSITCPNLINPKSTKTPVITYADDVLASFYGTVTDGVFEIEIETPITYQLRPNVPTTLALSAYSPTLRTGAASTHTFTISTENASAEEQDNQSPVITQLEYDSASQSILLSVSDNRSLNIDNHALNAGLSIDIDGKPYTGLTHFMNIEPGTPITASGKIPCSHLTRGDHFVDVSIKDYCNNETSARLSFTIGTPLPQCALTAERTATDAESISFTLSDMHSNSPQGRLMIATIDGETIISMPFEGTEINCKLTDSEGLRISSGIYKAWVIIDSPEYSSSAPISFAVLDNIQQ